MNTTSYHIVACRSRGAMPKIRECSAHSLKWVEAGEKKKKRVVGQQRECRPSARRAAAARAL